MRQLLTGIHTVTIDVRDYQKAIDFYTTKLGMILTANEPSFDHYEVAPQDATIPGICFNEDPKSAGAPTSIVFGTRDIHGTCKILRERGVKVTEPYEAHGVWWAGFRDPDGNSYGLRQV